MKKIYNLIALFALTIPFFGIGQTVTIGAGAVAGTTGSNVGVIYRSSAASAFDFSHNYYLYTAAELSAVGITPGATITSIAWYKDNAFGTDPLNTLSSWNVYMKNSGTVPGAAWSSGNFATQSAGATLVYANAAQNIPAVVGWVTLTLTTPFVYTGGSIEIGSQWDCSLYVGNPTTGGFAWRRDNLTNQTFGGSNSTSAVTMALQTARPQIQLTYTPGAGCAGMPTAGTATSSANPVCPANNFSLSLTGGIVEAGLTYQWQSSPDGITYNDIVGATSPSYVGTQSSDTYYQCIVTCTASAMSNTSAPVFVTTNNFLNCYCTSNATSAADEEITNVSFATMNNASTCATTGGPGSVLGMYSNYTATVPAPIVAASATYPFSVTFGTCGGNFTNIGKIWIDFNQNGSFSDPGELVYTSPAVSGTHTEVGNITIPASASIGLTRMRIVQEETGLPANVTECGTYTWGETEDYLVDIAPVPTCPQPTALSINNSDNSSVELAWTNGGVETEWQIEYGPNGFVPGTGTLVIANSNPFTIGGLSTNSFYQGYIRAICGPGDTSFWSGTFSWNTYNQGIYMEWNSDCPAAGFIDISTTGQDLLLTDDSEVGIAVLPFPILFQGVLYTNMTVGNNGGLQLGTTTGAIGYGGNFNTMANGTMFAWGDDLDDETGNVYIEQIGVSPNSVLIIQWDEINNFVGAIGDPTVTFQIQIDEATGEIFYVYDDVIFGGTDAIDDYGAAADIGISGPNQDITVSTNNVNYLTNNSCAHFFYSDCPNPINFTVVYTTNDEAGLSWSAGLAGETNWTLIYGPEGFDPLVAGTTITTTSPVAIIPGLDDITTYDIYIYADCNPGVLQSSGVTGQFITLPNCSDVTGLATATDIDSVFTNWSWVESSGIGTYPSTGFNLQYGFSGFDLYDGTETIVNADNNFSDTTENVSFVSGGVYQMYVQAVCGVDTSNWVGPLTFTMPLTNDPACSPENLMVDGTVYVMSNVGATVEVNESTIAPPATGYQTSDGWGNSNTNFTTWFTFTAPASGNVSITGIDVNFDGQIAIYDVTDCTNFGSFTLLAANDDALSGAGVAPEFSVCGLTAGNTYYLMHDSWSTSLTGMYSIALNQIVVEAGSSTGLLDACSGAVVDLFDGMIGYDMGGSWLEEIPTAGFADPLFATAGLAYQVFTFEYEVVNGCARDTAEQQVQIYGPSSAGIDGSMTVCQNEPVNLLAGLSGNVDLGGTWYDPSNNPLPSGAIIASWIPGSFNYDYITGNGVCPDDTANVVVNVSPTCDYLNIQEEFFGAMDVYPNPTSGIVYVANPGATEVFNFEITDVNGKVIVAKDAAINGTETTEINLSDITPGVYMIQVFNDNATTTYRIIKQ